MFHRISKATYPRFQIFFRKQLNVNFQKTYTASVIENRKISIDDEKSANLEVTDYRAIFHSKKLSELIRALFVFKLCSSQFLVQHSVQLMTVSKRILGNHLHTRLMKGTKDGQFVAGETERDLQDRVAQLLENGIGPMLCVPIEEDAGKSMYAQLSRLYPDPLTNIDVLKQIVKVLEGADVKFTKVDTKTDKNLSDSLDRLRTIGKTAEGLGVRLLIDAEYTYLNPALRLLTLAMMMRFNRQKPIVAYTYQNYLKETYGYMVKDGSLVRAYGASFAVKLVRGAYMTSERRLAVEGGYEDPVHATFKQTTDMYNKSMEMKEKALESADGSVIFGQTYGMSDYLSSALIRSGYVVYKSTPYGPVEETIPYLHRRAIENSSVLSGIQKERQLLWKAFIDRLTLSRLPRKPI